MRSLKTGIGLLLLAFALFPVSVHAQVCTNLGQTPASAFPVCGTTTFHQGTVPLCSTNNILAPGCSQQDPQGYQNRNPYYYKFTCYQTGTLGFTITPLAANEDYDWQMWDITGVTNLTSIFSSENLVVAGNWAGTYGATGASATGVAGIQCGSNPAANLPTFAAMPTLIEGHQYLLMVSHFTDGQSGYDLSFNGGTAVITDPKLPHLASASPDCDGKKITVKLNKRMRCTSITDGGEEFSLLPAAANVISATVTSCATGFDMEEIELTLSAPLPSGNYELVIKNGSDGNTLLDNCERPVPEDERVPFTYFVPQPIFADSIGTVACAPQSINIYFPKKIDCATISPDGSDFTVSGPFPVSVASAGATCLNGQTTVVTVNFTAPVMRAGTYNVTLKAGIDGTTIIDECGIELPTHTRSFVASDTVNADFDYISSLDCRFNTLDFSHNGANNVNSWEWIVNGGAPINTRTHRAVFSASSTNTVKLTVSNGVCTAEATETIVLNNEVIAAFDMPPVICPEDELQLTNNSTGAIDRWRWTFDGGGPALTVKDPLPFLLPNTNRQAYYNVKLVTTNTALGCSDSIQKKLTVLNNCFIAVPSAFTPNGDGLNDFLYPNNAIKAQNLEFRVYNRWGQLVFLSRDWTKKWDGKINGILQSPGVFVWYLSYTHQDTGQKVFQKGTTTLIL